MRRQKSERRRAPKTGGQADEAPAAATATHQSPPSLDDWEIRVRTFLEGEEQLDFGAAGTVPMSYFVPPTHSTTGKTHICVLCTAKGTARVCITRS